jgi:hypothetical protein
MSGETHHFWTKMNAISHPEVPHCHVSLASYLQLLCISAEIPENRLTSFLFNAYLKKQLISRLLLFSNP